MISTFISLLLVRETRIPVRGRRPDGTILGTADDSNSQRNTNPRKGTETVGLGSVVGSSTSGQRNTNPRKGTETMVKL